MLLISGKDAALADVLYEFLHCRRDGDRKEDAEEARERAPNDERENNEQGRYSDDARYDKRVDEVVLELLGDDVERDGEKPERHAAVDERDTDRRYRREGGPENRDYLEDGRDDGK